MRRITNDDKEIRQWASRRNAHPVEHAPFAPDGEPANLGFVFGPAPLADTSLQPIPWSRFLAIFHLVGLVLSYDDDAGWELLKAKEQVEGYSPEGRAQA